ncbi:YitT family protein [Fusibacter sp. A2]|uniref:YitT family protein n=1 Tax=Fusibacter sp. A2 TaxID=2929473 RepID=UPI001FA9DD49|nr:MULTISPECIES: YitT family protein [unclassified Fusibacter]MCK8061411.1 YitT family protein [Fusibacter sp. A2]
MKDSNKIMWDVVYVLAGMMILAFAITAILEPNQLITGGITGISIILGTWMGIDYTIFYYVLSLGTLLATFLLLGKREAKKIVILSVTFPLVLMIFNQINFNLTENDMFLASVYYGVVGGLGAGLILKRGYSSGGSDSIGKIIHKRLYPFISISLIITTIDILIVITSMLVYDIKVALYALITQFVFLKSVEVVLFGLGTQLMKLEIISNSQNEIEEYIMHEIKRGISKYMILGGYTNQERVKIVTICSPRESMLIKQFIAKMDEDAFVDILPVSSVWGKGLGFSGLTDDD